MLLIIEVDGFTHETDEAMIKDQIRDEKLAEVGFTILRFSAWEVLNRIDDVAILIREWIEENAKVEPKGKNVRRGKEE